VNSERDIPSNKGTTEHDRFNLKANFGDGIVLSEPFEAPSGDQKSASGHPISLNHL
jgi:hypothetical protein